MADYRSQYDETPQRPERERLDGAGASAWQPRERGGYWRQYDSARQHGAGRGPTGYKRSNDRVVVEVTEGEVTLSGSVTSRDQKRRAEDVAERGVRDVTTQLRIMRTNGHDWAADSPRVSGPGTSSPQPVSEAAGKETPSKTTSGTSA